MIFQNAVVSYDCLSPPSRKHPVDQYGSEGRKFYLLFTCADTHVARARSSHQRVPGGDPWLGAVQHYVDARSDCDFQGSFHILLVYVAIGR